MTRTTEKPNADAIYQTWEKIEHALSGVVKPLDNEMLLFLASENVAEVNGIVAEVAQEELAKREIAYH